MEPQRAARLVGAVLLLTPAIAHAHGEQVLLVILYLPNLVVAISLTLAVRKWEATLAAKLWTLLAVLGTTALLFSFNYAYQGGAIPIRLGDFTYACVLIAQVVVPVVVWWTCRRVVSVGKR